MPKEKIESELDNEQNSVNTSNDLTAIVMAGGQTEESDDAVGEAEGSQEPTDPVEEPGTPGTQTQQFSPSILARAKRLNVTPEWVGTFRDETEFAGFLDSVESDTPAAKQEKKADDFNLNIDSDLVDEEVSRAFKQLHGHYQGKIGAMEDRMKQMEDQSASTRRVESDRFIEDFVSGLDDSWSDVLGKKAGSQRNVNISKLKNQMRVLEAGHSSSGQALPPRRELAQQALSSAFHEKTTQIARDDIQGRIAKQKRKVTSRPTHVKKGLKITSVDRAIQAADKMLKESGISN